MLGLKLIHVSKMMIFNGRLANRELTSQVKEASGDKMH